MRTTHHRIGRCDGARPEPSDDRQFLSNVWLEVFPLNGHVFGNSNFRIKMANSGFGLVPHPSTVVADVLGQPLRAFPIHVSVAIRVYRRAVGEFRRYLASRLGYQHGDWIEVRPMRPQSQPLRFQRNRTAAAERVANRRRLFGEIFQHLFRLIALRRSLAAPAGD